MNFLDYLLNPVNWPGDNGIWDRVLEHLVFTGLAMACAMVVAIPLGVLIGHTGRGEFLVIGLSNAARAIPTLGLLVLVVTLIGTSTAPIVFALAVLALPPILTATAEGIRGADASAVHAGRALGMTEWQVVTKVEWPLALPLIISGLRSAALQVVATATVAALTPAGGLGRLIVDGPKRDGGYPMMIAGALLVAGMAIVIDLVLGVTGWLLARRARPGQKMRPEQKRGAVPAGDRRNEQSNQPAGIAGDGAS